MTFNVLITSAGRRVALLEIFQRALRELDVRGRVLAADRSRLSAAFHSADEALVVPPVTSGDYVSELLARCRERDVKLLIPTIDPELPVLAAHRETFEEAGIAVAISSPKVVAIAEDKSETHAWLLREGFPTVRQTTPEDALARADEWPLPLLVKPAAGSSSIGVRVVGERRGLEEAAADGYIVEMIAPGIEYTIDLLADRSGRCVSAAPRRRIETRTGETSKGVSVRSEVLEELGRLICEALPGAYGPLTVQAFHDEVSGEVNVIEINPRFAGGFPLSDRAGAEHATWMIQEILGVRSTAHPDALGDGVVMLRYDEAVFVSAKDADL